MAREQREDRDVVRRQARRLTRPECRAACPARVSLWCRGVHRRSNGRAAGGRQRSLRGALGRGATRQCGLRQRKNSRQRQPVSASLPGVVPEVVAAGRGGSGRAVGLSGAGTDVGG